MNAIQRFQRCWRFLPALALAFALGIGARAAMAADYGAVTSGTWSDPSTWTSSAGPGVPGSYDNAYIASTYPSGAAATAYVASAALSRSIIFS